MRTKTALLAIIFAFVFTGANATGIVGSRQEQGQAQGQGQVQLQDQTQIQGQSQRAVGIGVGVGIGIGQGGAGGAGGAGGVGIGGEANAVNAGNIQTSNNKVDQTISNEVINPRQLPGMPMPGQTLFPSFYDDPEKMPDWRVSPASELIEELSGKADLVDIIRLSSSSVKIGDALLRETVGEPKSVQFLGAASTDLRLMGSVSGYSENDKLTTSNCLASAVLYAAKKGATHFVLVKDGFRRAGTFYGWHIGLGGGASGLAGDAGASAGGGAVSIGPGVTSAESVRVDRPFVTIKCYYQPGSAPK
jgi:hypothetical protein